MPHNGQDDFYVGYLKEAPASLAKAVRRNIVKMLLVVIAVAAGIAFSQKHFYWAGYDYGTPGTFTGTYQESPYPTLWVKRPGTTDEASAHSIYYLVQEGKFGMQGALPTFDGKQVELKGVLVYHDGQTMLEINPTSVKEVPNEPPAIKPALQDLGEHTFRGEIVDSKCFLGVMNPGHLKIHKACAVRCISGGIPPVFLVRNETGQAQYLLLVSKDGKSVNQDVLDRVAEPLEITGKVMKQNDLMILHADPTTYRSL